MTTISDVKKWDGVQPLSEEFEDAVSHYLTMRVKKSTLPCKSLQFKTGGPHVLTLAPLTVARKESQNVTQRTIQNRSKETKELLQIIAGSSSEAVATQASHFVKSLDASAREEILNGFKQTVTVPEVDVAAMKATLNIPWNLLRDIRRWLKTFKIKMASEAKSRDIVKEWVGTGLRCEELPASVIKSKNINNRVKALVLFI